MTISYLFPPDDTQAKAVEIPKPKRDTKAIGDRSELEVAIALARVGYLVSKPLFDSHRYDLIIDDGEKLFRVQVKTGRLRGGSIKVPCFSTHAQGPTVLQRSYRGEIDFIGVFCPQTGEVYMVPESEIVDSTMHLRVAPTINRQDRHIRWAHRFKLA